MSIPATHFCRLCQNCIKAFVDTMSFQAPEFYQRLGFEEIVRIKDFYQGYDRIFYSKMI
jgi:ribosomal protein S18 acetylase RimI-like enzyme